VATELERTKYLWTTARLTDRRSSHLWMVFRIIIVKSFTSLTTLRVWLSVIGWPVSLHRGTCMLIVLLERSLWWDLRRILHSCVNGPSEILMWSTSLGRAHLIPLSWNRWQLLVPLHAVSQITTRLWSNCWRWSSHLLCPLHFLSSFLNGLPRCGFLRVCSGGGSLSFPLQLTLTFRFLSTLLFLLSALFLFVSSTLSLDFLLRLSFPLGSKLILLTLAIMLITQVRSVHTCSFFLAAASSALDAADLKLFVDALLCIELLLAFFFKVF
jgi:hypothetical protein